ncbi:MAG: cytochrome c nitrite reductase small subunit [Thermoguttaceae bacterium]|jgi:cytochrome c nitrite reductase small subunit
MAQQSTRSANYERPGHGPLHRLLAWSGTFSIALAVMLGVLGGIGAFTFGYGQGSSYLSNNPQACVNCHVMQEHYNSWQNSSHHHVAVCNDCHLPHDFVGKWATKADNGFFHSLAFTLENFHEPIQIKPRNRRVTQNACLHCHQATVHQMLPATGEGEMLSCVHCHSDVGHAHR